MQEARLWRQLKDDTVQCRLCNHFCSVRPDERGKCGVRENQGGTLYSLVADRVAATNVDPIEKKPLYHFQPGSHSLSVGTVGCNFFCLFCQNDALSQSPKSGGPIPGEPVTPQQIVQAAKQYGCKSISYTYNEPTMFYELMRDCAELAKGEGLANVMVSNGFMSPECLDELEPWIDAINVDFKAYTEHFYNELCGTRLEPVLENLKRIKRMGWWLEVTTLIIPGQNDSEQELEGVAAFIRDELGPETPWHLSRFHPCYQMTQTPSTPITSLETAHAIGRKAGLQFVYLGNVPGREEGNTYCPDCGQTLIQRSGFSAGGIDVENGNCCGCGHPIAGVDLG